MPKSKEQLQEELKELGATYDGRWNAKKLSSLLRKTRRDLKSKEMEAETPDAETPDAERLKNIADEIQGKNRMTVEELEKMTTKVDGDAVTKSGIIVPAQVLAKLPRTKFEYVLKCSSETATVIKIDPRGIETFVRSYELSIHGENFQRLAEGFVAKNNK